MANVKQGNLTKSPVTHECEDNTTEECLDLKTIQDAMAEDEAFKYIEDKQKRD
jgi:hypothetical protein